MKKTMFSILAIIATCAVNAQQKYNGFTGHWETVPSDSQLKYNGFEDSWSYQPKDAQLEYNGFEDTWEWNSGYN